ncbi:MAG: CpaF family protein [Bdellovibrionaceae bacterium]|nr:CpaF family protein [Pseudobdellovibrionaceae bacterium]MBX3034396.1 CpaF family protein [Pseudobdellovibrionaceae bacterium]
MSLSRLYLDLEQKILSLHGEGGPAGEDHFLREREDLLNGAAIGLDEPESRRLRQEFDEWGPLTDLLEMPGLTEILVNGPDTIWYEKNGRLHRWPDRFFSNASHQRCLDRLCQQARALVTLERPSADGRWRDFRLHVIRPPLTREHVAISLRRHPENPWTLEALRNAGWCREPEALFLRSLIGRRLNFLVVGPTGCGKTSVVNSLLGLIAPDERVGIIEDTDEIAAPAGPSFKLLTRPASPGGLGAVDQGELVRQCLRMRPDRLVMGEIRGPEAKDFLMALSTGHGGSFGTLHAEDPAQALIRLEMLIQMGASHWGLTAIRKLIRLGLHYIIVVGKNENGGRFFKGAHRLVSLEETGFLLEKEELP